MINSPKLPQPSKVAEHFPARDELEDHVQIAIVLHNYNKEKNEGEKVEKYYHTSFC